LKGKTPRRKAGAAPDFKGAIVPKSPVVFLRVEGHANEGSKKRRNGKTFPSPASAGFENTVSEEAKGGGGGR